MGNEVLTEIANRFRAWDVAWRFNRTSPELQAYLDSGWFRHMANLIESHLPNATATDGGGA